uniref:Clan AA aspartic protease, AF_0612 family n=1 Tax=Candidatus Kentrum eta TaxID=2126337 RepID=A0A450VF97_9GAMM|nr:MAG: clan AA aspartic protease, AF_0612 family [Candidatus Kentron sp. H]VFJ98462.1 MAG: clan AA aspartic protease, AF_0612 family [Candidatus Kentron sp. H]VFK03455.1 MAG: clan AA aspartic protease, AF_0612 family [Candidatus Kentron sp. H]
MTLRRKVTDGCQPRTCVSSPLGRRGRVLSRSKTAEDNRIPSPFVAPQNIPDESKKMGFVHVATTIRNPADPERSWDGLFLVDTGATDCMVPRCHLEAIGLSPRGQRTYELADGSELKMDVAVGEIEFMGEIVGGTVIFGNDDIEPILGVTALESVGIDVDPLNQRLKRLPAVRLK